MHEFHIFGAPRVTAPDGGPVESLSRQPRRLALLAYLALAEPRGPHRRDKLIALFWPDADTAHARAALSQAVYVLRNALGEHAIVSAGDELLVERNALWCDATTFEDLLDDGRHEEALALYRGDLMDGFFVAGAPAFEEWAEVSRRQLRARAHAGAWSVAERCRTEGDAVRAAEWAWRATGYAQADEAAARRLMLFLDALGDRAAALRAYADFASQLERSLEVAPSPETSRLAQSIRERDMAAARGEAALAPLAPAPAAPTAPAAPAFPGPPVRRRSTSWRVVSFGIAAVALAATAVLAARREPPTGIASEMQFPLELPATPPLAFGIPGTTVALSPSGDRLVYVGAAGNGTQLFMRRMNRIEPESIPHTRGARMPFFSPDGAWLGFLDGFTTVRKMRLDGGAPETVATVAGLVSGASWNADAIAFATQDGLWLAPARGGEAATLVANDSATGVLYRWPDVLPGGAAVLATRVRRAGYDLVAVTRTGKVVPLGIVGTNPRFVVPDHLLYVTVEGALHAVPFDERALRVTGAARPVTDQVLVGGGGGAKFGLSGTGLLAYVPQSSDRVLVLVDRAGREDSIRVPPQEFGHLEFSPDGRSIATEITDERHQRYVWLIDVASGTQRPLTTDDNSAVAVWSPDGRRIVYASNPAGRSAGFALVAMSLADSRITTIQPRATGQLPLAITPDGRELLFRRRNTSGNFDVWVADMGRPGSARPLLSTSADERMVSFSSDGRWFAYASDESGRLEIYITRRDATGTPLKVSEGGGSEPRWSRTANEVFYRSSRGMMAVRVDTGARLSAAAPRLLFDDRAYQSATIGAAYDVHPDGQRFVMARRGRNSRSIVVVLNWLTAPR